MLIMASVLSLILLATAYYCVRVPGRSLGPFFVCGLAFTFGCIGVGTMSPVLSGTFPVVWLQFFLLSVVVIALKFVPHYRSRLALLLTFGATVAAYGVASGYALYEFREYNGLREVYRYESLEDRLSVIDSTSSRKALTPDQGRLLQVFEENADHNRGLAAMRASRLRMLHEGTVLLFVNSQGFGVGRLFLPSEEFLRVNPPDPGPLPQPVPRPSPSAYPTANEADLRSPQSSDLLQRHWSGVIDFANLMESGYVKDRQHVAGFRPHRFSTVPKATDGLILETVDLVSLLRHDEPVAYVSANLPRMDELREAPTRPLDAFELAALKRIQESEDLVTADAGMYLRMLGSIRCAKQCVNCHGGERGDLLGAFSYTLRKKGT